MQGSSPTAWERTCNPVQRPGRATNGTPKDYQFRGPQGPQERQEANKDRIKLNHVPVAGCSRRGSRARDAGLVASVFLFLLASSGLVLSPLPFSAVAGLVLPRSRLLGS
jgi:hypothetical protein